MSHFFFEAEVYALIRNGSKVECTAFLNDLSARVIRQDKQLNTGEEQEPWIEDLSLSTKLSEQAIDMHQDREDNQYTIFITQREGHNNYGIWAMYEYKLSDITDQFEDKFHSKPNIVFLFSINEVTEFILQHGHIIDLYTINFEELIPEGMDKS